jgi:uncharacterized protein (UPF0548 family)
MFFVHRPSTDAIDRFLRDSQALPLSYGPIGIVREPIGLAGEKSARGQLDEEIVVIGHGHSDFDRARAALMEWKQFDIGWIETFPQRAPVAVGTVVAVLIHHLGFWSLNGCRVLYGVDCPAGEARFGFAYGTLTNHAESGEELFEVFVDSATGDVMYRIRAMSWPQTTLARIGQPIVRALQARFRRHSAAAMKRATHTDRVQRWGVDN